MKRILAPESPLRRMLALGCALALPLLATLHPGCRASRPDETDPPAVQLSVEVIPILLPADSAQTATVWVTVWDAGAPVADSTRVDLAASAGTVPAVVYTHDGLATAVYQPASKAGSASIVAQCRGVRDTTLITLF